MKFRFNGEEAPPDSTNICVLYEPKGGKIVHLHGHTTFKVGQKLTHQEMEMNARLRLEALGRSSENLRALQVSDADFDPSVVYRVDLVNKALVVHLKPPARRPKVGR
jgi:hypothetical protein